MPSGAEPRPNGTPAPSQAATLGATCERHEASPSKPQTKAAPADRLLGNLPKSGPPKSAPATRAEPPRPSEPPEGMASRPSPSSSSRAPAGTPAGANSEEGPGGVRVYPEQLVTQDLGALGEYAQFVCKICNLVVRAPLVLPCAHMFCSKCFDNWVQQKRPNVKCPTCEQAVRPQEVVHFEGRSSSSAGGALALLHRLYAGMKVRCVYHSELAGGRPLTPEVERARALKLSCSWRGAMHDYSGHLNGCEVHGAVTSGHGASSSTSSAGTGAGGARSSTGLSAPPVAAPAAAPPAPVAQAGKPPVTARLPVSAPTAPTSATGSSTRPEPSWTHITGAFQALAPWHSPEAGALCVRQGATLWVTSTDESGEWAYARVLQAHLASANTGDVPPHAWVPRAVLRRAMFAARNPFDAQGQAQGLSLDPGDLVHVYHREASGWTYGARLPRRASDGSSQGPEEVGWFPEACIAEPLPTA